MLLLLQTPALAAGKNTFRRCRDQLVRPRIEVSECSPAEPTVTAMLQFEELPAYYQRRCRIVWYLGGTPQRTCDSFLLKDGARSACPFTICFDRDTPPAIRITAVITFDDGCILTASAMLKLNNYGPEFYDRIESLDRPYSIDVILNQNTVIVYAKDEQGEYTIVQNVFLCSTGPYTPGGWFSKYAHYPWRMLFGSASSNYRYVYGQYASTIWDNYLFHSVPYFSMKKDDLEFLQFNQLGQSVSLGCVRLNTQGVKWLYDHCPDGTTVHMYDSEELPVRRPASPKIDLQSSFRGWDPTDPDEANPWKNELSRVLSEHHIKLS